MQKFFKYLLLITVSFGYSQLNAQCDSVCKNIKPKKDFWASGVSDVTSFVWGLPPAGSSIIQTPSTGPLNDTGHYDFTFAAPGVYAITVQAINDCGIASKTFSIRVVDICYNQPPVAVNDTVQTNFNYPIEVNVLVNDYDPNGDSLRLISPITTPPVNGIVLLLNGKWIYKPNAGFIGRDSFKYTITDGNGGFASAWVYITINNSRPLIAVDDKIFTVGNQDTGNVKNNDVILIKDPVFTKILQGLSNSGSGTFVLNPDGTYTYVPAKDFFGADSVLYELYAITALGDTIRSQAWIYIENWLEPSIPEVITPNNDGVTDKLIIPNVQFWNTESMQIYNRWGDQVWNSKGAYSNDEPFEGRGLDDRILPDATYYYLLKYKITDSKKNIINKVAAGYIEVYR